MCRNPWTEDIDYLPEKGVDYSDCDVPMQLSAEIVPGFLFSANKSSTTYYQQRMLEHISLMQHMLYACKNQKGQ